MKREDRFSAKLSVLAAKFSGLDPGRLSQEDHTSEFFFSQYPNRTEKASMAMLKYPAQW